MMGAGGEGRNTKKFMQAKMPKKKKIGRMRF